MDKRPKIGMSFSGGGARATAHVGVIKALQEHGIEADILAGTSGGAIVGALYSAGLSVEKMIEFASEGKIYKLFRPKLPVRGLTSLTYLEKLLEQYIGNDSFEALKIPLSVVASNLMTGKKEYFDSGKLYEAVMASCAIPLVFKPIKINGQRFVDGGIFDNMPITPLQGKCDMTIGVNLIPIAPLSIDQVDSIFSVGMRVFDMQSAQNSRINFPFFDIVIEIPDLINYSIFSFGSYKELYELGYNATKEKMPEILAVLKQKTNDLS